MAHLSRSLQSSLPDASSATVGSPGPWRVAIAGTAMLAALAGWFAGPVAGEVEPDLARLLQLMAVLKAATAMAALGLIGWRLAEPVGAARGAAYTAAVALMAAGPGLIWRLDHVAVGAILFHAGMALAVVTGWRDPGFGVGLSRVLHRKRTRQLS